MRVKVPLFRTSPVRAVLIDSDATPGAVVGRNLYNLDGTLWEPPSTAAATPDSGISLDDVQALATAPLTVEGSLAEGAFTFGWAGTTSDVPEGSRRYFRPARSWVLG